MTQIEAVEAAMKGLGGYATLGQLYQTATKAEGVTWRTKTPFASIRRIVQDPERPETERRFFKIRPGLWALSAERDAVLDKLGLGPQTPRPKILDDAHTFYQGLLLELGSLRGRDTFAPDQDKNRSVLPGGTTLGVLRSLATFPAFTYDALLASGRTIDVSWFNERNLPDAFFEVESTTDMKNSLLKFVEFQDFRVRFHIVADGARRAELDQRLTLAAFAPLRSRVQFMDYAVVARMHDAEMESAAARQIEQV
jgi:hypothetical protein